MSPQFVDFDGNGLTDILAGTFSGSPWISIGTTKGWSKPEQILDQNGKRIVLNQFWNYQTEKWDSTNRCDDPHLQLENGHCTSAFAIDFDQDGDFDLLLGDYDTGQLFLRRNGGTAKKPAFGTINERLSAGSEPIDVGKMATMRVLDWNGDGHSDLLIGSMGDTYGQGPGGAVLLFPGSPRRGDNGDMAFDAPVTLIAAEGKSGQNPKRPDAGLYADAADHDGDGDLDLVVGGYSMWTPNGRELTTAEQQKVAILGERKAELMKQIQKLGKRLQQAVEGLGENEAKTKRKEVLKAQSKMRRELSSKLRDCTAQLNELVPSPQRKSFVWFYENITTAATTGGQR
ncbi:MAG: FG-GAP-like repeat-containing protein [bacterium]|nr:FG-GAP-like repeat-containing protein [bacterium]